MTAPVRSTARQHRRQLTAVLVLTTVYLAAEVVGGVLTHSLALLADAGHMLTDVAGLALAMIAIWFADRPATPERTFGYYRAEILAALANGIVLFAVSIYILFEAYRRFIEPPAVASGPMLAVASIGLGVNLISVRLLRSGSSTSLNVKGAYFEVLSDTLSSIGVIVAAIIMLLTGWYYADPIISAGIGLFIFPRTWRLVSDAVGILLEGTPTDVDMARLRERLSAISGVDDVHDVHVWSLTSDLHALSAHIVSNGGDPDDAVLERVRDRLRSEFKIDHVTIQVERRRCEQPHV